MSRPTSGKGIIVALALAACTFVATGQPADLVPVPAEPKAAQPAPETPPGSSEPEADEPPSDPRIDEATGRAKLNWSKARHFDQLHMKLAINIPTMAEAKLSGVEELTMSAIGRPRTQVVLDCAGPEVIEVTCERVACSFEKRGPELVVTLPEPAPPGAPVTLRIAYDLDFSKQRGEGLTWVRPREQDDSETQNSPQIYSQGEAQSNSRWFACHDFPNERLTTEMEVTVEDGFEVLSNGTLVAKEKAGEGRTRWHWKQDKTHVNYLVALYVGKCAVVEIGGPDSARPGLAMPVYCPLGTEDRAREAFANVPAMIKFFEEYFDEPYPWDKYAQACIRTFSGGMENTSATFLGSGTASRKRGAADDLVAHELAHQWTGDLITCKSWDHIWLNEGWATFAECLWVEHRTRLEHAGEEAVDDLAREAYEKSMVSNVRSQRRINKAKSPQIPAMVSNRYSNPDAVFARIDNAYSKGSVVLHMLRERLGHDVFDRGMRQFIDTYRFNVADTDDFRRVMEAASGQSLELFFDQWVMRPGIPRVTIDFSYDDTTRTLKVSGEQTQFIDGYNPAFVLALPIRVAQDGGEKWVTLHLSGRTGEASVVLESAPMDYEVDPRLTQLASIMVHKPLAMWQEQLRHGSTVFARSDAKAELYERPVEFLTERIAAVAGARAAWAGFSALEVRP